MKIFSIRNLLLLTAFLLICNLATWYWFVAGMHLRFDAETFDHVVSPISSILAFAGIIFALLSAINQNKIAQSQNARPYFDKEIDRIEAKIASNVLKPRIVSPSSREYTGFTYIQYVNDLVNECTKDLQFAEDLEKSMTNNIFEVEYMYHRTYCDKVMIVSEFAVGVGNRFEYDNISQLINEINESMLLDMEKTQLKRRIKKEIIGNYLSYIKWFGMRIFPTFPVFTIDHDTDNVRQYYKFIHLDETPLAEYYDFFNKELGEGKEV